MYRSLTWLAACIMIIEVHVSACGQIGTNYQSALSYPRHEESHFFLNVQNPATSSGAIKYWEYCFYTVHIEDGKNYTVSFSAYRETEGETYIQVSDTVTITLHGRDISDNDGFVCRRFEPNSVSLVEEGDVLGACVYNSEDPGLGELEIVGKCLNIPIFCPYHYLYFQTNTGCGSQSLPSTVVLSDMYWTGYPSILHLFANIVESTARAIDDTRTSVTTTFTVNNNNKESTNNHDSTLLTTSTPSHDINPILTTATMSISVVSITSSIAVSNNNSNKNIDNNIDNNNHHNNKNNKTDNNNSKIETSSDGPTGTNMTMYVALAFGTVLLFSTLVICVLALALITKRRKKRGSVKLSSVKKKGRTESTKRLTSGAARTSTLSVELELKPRNRAGRIVNAQNLIECDEIETSLFDLLEQSASISNSYSMTYAKTIEENLFQDIYESFTPYKSPSQKANDIYLQLKSLKVTIIQRQSIESLGHLGSGQFGTVNKGCLKCKDKKVEVALKTLNKGSGERKRVKFLQEAAIMAQFNHPNVITLYGVVTKGEPTIIVVELAHNGDLRTFLSSSTSSEDLARLFLNFSQQVALGIQYLAGKGFVHRDLAARNILVSKDNICKIADFGMSRHLNEEHHYVSHGGGKLPVRWMSPEALNYNKFSTASDVWSYGCVLYEIWSLGKKPFDGTHNSAISGLISSGVRLSPPPGCPRLVYELMIKCWHPNSLLRPNFRDAFLHLVCDQKQVLSIPQEALNTHQLAGVLGAPLEAGEMMYRDLQTAYLIS